MLSTDVVLNLVKELDQYIFPILNAIALSTGWLTVTTAQLTATTMRIGVSSAA